MILRCNRLSVVFRSFAPRVVISRPVTVYPEQTFQKKGYQSHDNPVWMTVERFSTRKVELNQGQINSTSNDGPISLVHKTCLAFSAKRLTITSFILLTSHLHHYHSDHVEPVETIPDDNETEQGSCQRFPG